MHVNFFFPGYCSKQVILLHYLFYWWLMFAFYPFRFFFFFFVALGESDARPLENWIIKPSYWFFSWVYSWCYHVGTLALNHAERVLLAAWQLFPLICFVTFPLFTIPSLPKGGESENHYVESFHFPVRVFLLNATQMVGFLFLFSPNVNKQISKC